MSLSSIRYGYLVASILGIAASASHATNGDQMLGVTATQWGMGGATTAAPQDAGTVLTNPAGLAVIEFDDFRADMGFGFMNPPRKANGNESDSNLYLIPSGALAFRVNDRLSTGMGMAGLSGMGVDFPDISPAPGNQTVVTTKQFYKIAPGFAYRVSETLSLGAALNIDYQSLAMYNNSFQLPQNQAYGYGASLGAIYRPNHTIQLGLSYISRQNMDAFVWNTTSGRYEMTMDAPEQYSIGLAYMPADGLLVAADIKHIRFSEVLDKVDMETPGGSQTINFGWSDQTVYAIAVQKRVSEKTTVRLGYNYGASPIEEEDVVNNIGSLAVTEQHLTFGVTQAVGKRVSASFSYAKAFHNEVESDTTPTSIELEQNIVNFQISYKN